KHCGRARLHVLLKSLPSALFCDGVNWARVSTGWAGVPLREALRWRAGGFPCCALSPSDFQHERGPATARTASKSLTLTARSAAAASSSRLEKTAATTLPLITAGAVLPTLKRATFDYAIADQTKAIEMNPGLAEAFYNRGSDSM